MTGPLVEDILAWLYHDELLHSRLIWRLEADRRLPDPWPYAGVWHDPGRAALVDFQGHPELGVGEVPWLQLEGSDLAAAELLAAVRLPMSCEVLCRSDLAPAVEVLGQVQSMALLDVYACGPGELGEAALSYEPTKLTRRDRAMVAAAGWRPADLDHELDEADRGARWAIVRDGAIVSRLLVQIITANIAEIADVQTCPERRKKGYGAALVQNITRRMHERGLTVTYSVHPSNLPSRRLAEAIGFTPRFSWQRLRLDRG